MRNPDDEEIETPPDVVAMLGFDPVDEYLAEDAAGFDPNDHPHAVAGTAKGGQFVKTGEGGGPRIEKDIPQCWTNAPRSV